MSFMPLEIGQVVDGGYHYGRTNLVYRGAPPDLEAPFVAILGGAEVYGPFVELPFPALLDQELPLQVLNFGARGGGPTLVMRDPVLLETCNRAQAVVLSVSHAWAVTNRLYTVGHQQNTALHEISEQLASLFPLVDFDVFEHVRPMLCAMAAAHQDNFRVVELELREAWLARMRDLIERIEAPVILFAMADHLLSDGAFVPDAPRIGPEMVTRAMLQRLSAYAHETVLYEADLADQCLSGADRDAEGDALATALHFPGETMHVAAAEHLFPALNRLANKKRPAMATSTLRTLLRFSR